MRMVFDFAQRRQHRLVPAHFSVEERVERTPHLETVGILWKKRRQRSHMAKTWSIFETLQPRGALQSPFWIYGKDMKNRIEEEG
jgi:hypothetical protein